MNATECFLKFGYTCATQSLCRDGALAVQLLDRAITRMRCGKNQRAYIHAFCRVKAALESSQAHMADMCAPWFDCSAFGPVHGYDAPNDSALCGIFGDGLAFSHTAADVTCANCRKKLPKGQDHGQANL